MGAEAIARAGVGWSQLPGFDGTASVSVLYFKPARVLDFPNSQVLLELSFRTSARVLEFPNSQVLLASSARAFQLIFPPRPGVAALHYNTILDPGLESVAVSEFHYVPRVDG